MFHPHPIYGEGGWWISRLVAHSHIFENGGWGRTFSKMCACVFRVRFWVFLWSSISPKLQNFLRPRLRRSRVTFLHLWLGARAKTRHSWARAFNGMFFFDALHPFKEHLGLCLKAWMPVDPLLYLAYAFSARKTLFFVQKECPTMLPCKKPCTTVQDIGLTQGWVWHLIDRRQNNWTWVMELYKGS